MKFTTKDMNDIKWIANPDGAAGDTIRKIMGAGKWEEFLELQQDDETGEVDYDSLYDYLRFESNAALQSVGLHETEATATVEEVIAAWEKQNAPTKVKRENGEPCVSIYGDTLDMDTIDEDGEEYSESLYPDDVAKLIDNNANTGEWDTDDPETATFEAWIEE